MPRARGAVRVPPTGRIEKGFFVSENYVTRGQGFTGHNVRAPHRTRTMSFAISPTAFVVVGARAAPRGGAKARASSTRVTARVSGARVRVSPDLRGRNATALRASEDDPPPKEPAAPEQLSFPELSDDEEVRGSQITAIVTGTCGQSRSHQSRPGRHSPATWRPWVLGRR